MLLLLLRVLALLVAVVVTHAVAVCSAASGCLKILQQEPVCRYERGNPEIGRQATVNGKPSKQKINPEFSIGAPKLAEVCKTTRLVEFAAYRASGQDGWSRWVEAPQSRWPIL